MILASATGHRIHVLGSLYINIQIESTTGKHDLMVSSQLHADNLHGYQLIDKVNDSVLLQQKRVELINNETLRSLVNVDDYQCPS